MALRDKSPIGGSAIKDKTSLSILDIRGTSREEKHAVSRVFMSEWFDLEGFVKAHEE